MEGKRSSIERTTVFHLGGGGGSPGISPPPKMLRIIVNSGQNRPKLQPQKS